MHLHGRGDRWMSRATAQTGDQGEEWVRELGAVPDGELTAAAQPVRRVLVPFSQACLLDRLQPTLVGLPIATLRGAIARVPGKDQRDEASI